MLAWTAVTINRSPEHTAADVDAAVLAALSLPADSERPVRCWTQPPGPISPASRAAPGQLCQQGFHQTQKWLPYVIRTQKKQVSQQ